MVGFDPFDMVRRTTELVEKTLGDFLERRMRDPEAMKLMGQATSLALDVKRHTLAVLEKVHRSVDLPTRHDVETLSASINAIESRLIDIEDRLNDLGKGSNDRKAGRSSRPSGASTLRVPKVRSVARASSRRRKSLGRA